MDAFDNVPRSSRLDVVGRRVLVRADLDCTFSPSGAVLDDTRLREILPTVRLLRAQRAKVILAASFGTAAFPAPEEAQRSVAERLAELLGVKCEPLSRAFVAEIRRLVDRDVALLPNLARVAEEESNDPRWSSRLAQAVDVYVNDAPRASMRCTASVNAVPRRVAARAAGPILSNELDIFHEYSEAPSNPFTAVIGGGSVIDHEGLLRLVAETADAILLGGVVANTFLAATGVPIGASAVERAGIPIARDVLARAHARGIDVKLPIDAVVTTRGAADPQAAYAVRKIDQIGKDEAIVDIAVQTCIAYRDVLVLSSTVILNGVMGECKDDASQSGTIRVAQAASEARHSLLVGDNTVTTARQLRLASLFRNVAVAGSASLALLRGTVMPGVESLRPSKAAP